MQKALTCAYKRICETGITIVAALVLLNGCAVTPKSKTDVQKAQALFKKRQLAKQQREESRDRKLVLEQRAKLKSAAPSPDSDGDSNADSDTDLGVSIAAAPVTERVPEAVSKPLPLKLPARLPTSSRAPDVISVSPEKTGEHFLYSKILETYRQRERTEMQKTLALLLKSYPESVFADNALYLSGLLAAESGDFQTAQKSFTRLLESYPRSNKVAAALFAKASIEKKLGRKRQAKSGFLQVRNAFPGSPEAQRVAVELKLLGQREM